MNKRQNYLQALSLTGPATGQLLAHVQLSCVWLNAFVDINRDIPALDDYLALAILKSLADINGGQVGARLLGQSVSVSQYNERVLTYPQLRLA